MKKSQSELDNEEAFILEPASDLRNTNSIANKHPDVNETSNGHS
jgi:hypothetical protein